jgi:AraC-like DNA-binding protein
LSETPPLTCTALLARFPLQALAAAGLDWELEARRCGLPVTLEPEFRWRVPVDALQQLHQRGLEQLGPGFPVLAARRGPDQHTSPLGLYCRTRETGRQALSAMAQYWDLVTDAWWISFDEIGGEGVLRWHAHPAVGVPESLWWFELTDIAGIARGMVPGLPVFRVETSLGVPPGLGEGLEVVEGEGLALVFPKKGLEARLLTPDASLRAYTERLLHQLLSDRPSGSVVRSTIRACGPTATLEEVAARLGLSPRTLHRRLSAAGTSFRRELNAVRAERARDLVGTMSSEAVAEVLGYSDARALRRAARRWGG